MSGGPLAGVRVLDTTRALAGPLAHHGARRSRAEVIKVEVPRAGDETRYWGPPFAGDAGPTLIGYNRNKKSVALDLRTEEGGRPASTSPGAAMSSPRISAPARCGASASITTRSAPCGRTSSIARSAAMGRTGPMAARPAVDLMVQAVGGLMAQTGEARAGR